MKVVALIPVKLNNERIPNKNIKKFSDGTPLISLIQDACLNAKSVNETYIYCSSENIVPFIKEGILFLKRPAYLDDNTANSNDIIREFIKEVDSDVYVETHVTGPFTKSASIDACVNAVKNGGFDSAFLARCMREFIWVDGKPLNFDPNSFPRTQDLKPLYVEAPGAYVFTRETFKRFGRRVGNNPYIQEIDEIESRDIDYLEDFEIADAIYMNMIRNGGYSQ